MVKAKYTKWWVSAANTTAHLKEISHDSPFNHTIAKVWLQSGSFHYSIVDKNRREEILPAVLRQIEAMEADVVKRLVARFEEADGNYTA